MREKVAIIGAGVSGLIAAKNLATLGVATSVYEQKRRLGYPPKASGIVSINGLKSLGIDYRKAVTNTLYGANIHAGGEVVRVLGRKPQAHVLDREKLNLLCYEESIDRGARVFTGRMVDNGILDNLHKDSIVIGADGPLSIVAKRFGMGTIKGYVLTYKAEFDATARDTRAVDLFFDNSVVPEFFGWMCPNKRNTVEVGIGIDSKHGNSRSAFDRFLKIKEVSETIGKSRMRNGYASMIPMRTTRSLVNEKEEVLLVGDAAGQVKATTGGGIVLGGNAAIIAACTISDHIKKGRKLRVYERKFKKNFGTDMRLHRLLSRMYSNLDVNRIGFLMRVSKVFGLEPFLSKHGDMDRPSVMLRRFFLRGFLE